MAIWTFHAGWMLAEFGRRNVNVSFGRRAMRRRNVNVSFGRRAMRRCNCGHRFEARAKIFPYAVHLDMERSHSLAVGADEARNSC